MEILVPKGKNAEVGDPVCRIEKPTKYRTRHKGLDHSKAQHAASSAGEKRRDNVDERPAKCAMLVGIEVNSVNSTR